MNLSSNTKAPFYVRNGIRFGCNRIQAGVDYGTYLEVEYWYSARTSDTTLAKFACFGGRYLIDESGRREWLYTIDLGSEPALRGVMEMKSVLGSDDDDYTYLCDVAKGLLVRVEERGDANANDRHRVFTRIEALSTVGIPTPEGVTFNADGTITLAEVFLTSDVPTGDQ